MNFTAQTKMLRREVLLLASVLALAVAHGAHAAAARSPDPSAKLSPTRYKNGDLMLQAFSPVAEALRHSIVKLDVNGITSALATVVDTNGLALTKASELKSGKLTCWLAGGKEVDAEWLATDDQSDLALVRIKSDALVPVRWAAMDVAVGQWTVTPGIEATAHAVGIVSVAPRKILPKRAYIGVVLDSDADVARISAISPGLGAEKAGIKTNDVILAVDGVTIKGREQLVENLKMFREGATVKLRVQREDDEFDVNVELMSEQAMFGRRMFDRQAYMNRMGGDVSKRSEDFSQVIQHDTVLEPWLCGGPLANLDNEVIGINIARAGRVASYALPADQAKQALARLRAQLKERTTPVKAKNGIQ